MKDLIHGFITRDLNYQEIIGFKGCKFLWLQGDIIWNTTKNKIKNYPKRYYMSDGYSVPKIFWPLVNECQNFLQPAILHDYEYQTTAGKIRSDINLYKGMRSGNISLRTSLRVFAGVAIGGWHAYNEYKTLTSCDIDIIALNTAYNEKEAQYIASTPLCYRIEM